MGDTCVGKWLPQINGVETGMLHIVGSGIIGLSQVARYMYM